MKLSSSQNFTVWGFRVVRTTQDDVCQEHLCSKVMQTHMQEKKYKINKLHICTRLVTGIVRQVKSVSFIVSPNCA